MHGPFIIIEAVQQWGKVEGEFVRGPGGRAVLCHNNYENVDKNKQNIEVEVKLTPAKDLLCKWCSYVIPTSTDLLFDFSKHQNPDDSS